MQLLLAGLIDYAGMHAPAKLSLRDSLRNYVEYTNGDKKWMLSRFVLPHYEIPNLAHFADKSHRLHGPLSISVTTTPTLTVEKFMTVIRELENVVLHAHSQYPGELRTDVLEITLPSESIASSNHEPLIKAIQFAVSRMAENRLLPKRIYFEIPDFVFDAKILRVVMKAIALHNKTIQKKKIDNYLFSGFKLRCGGNDSSQYPNSGYISDSMIYARDANVAIKFSDGLRNPFRDFDINLAIPTQGFINVICAGLLSYAQDLVRDEMVEILNDESYKSFRFTNEYMSWKDLAIPVNELKMLRMLSLTSIGSSSFDIPVEELYRLRLIS